MNDHPPECPQRKKWLADCCCRELRACEQRVLEDDVLAAAYHGEKGYAMGYAVALNAAEDDLCAAAEREKQERDLDDLYDGIRYSIERIRALKEKS